MELQLCFSNINWWSVLVAAVSAFALGGLWYSPLLFSKPWVKLIGLDTTKKNEANMPLIFGTTFILNIIEALLFDLVLGPEATLNSGLTLGLIIGAGCVASSFGTNYLFLQKPFKLWAIDGGYYVVMFSIMGTIIGAW